MREIDRPRWSRGAEPSLAWLPSLPWCGARATHRPRHVREPGPRYEHEGAVREVRGAVAVGGHAWWGASLAVTLPQAPASHSIAMVRLTRHGPPAAGAARQDAIEFMVSSDELEAVVVLLAGAAARSRAATFDLPPDA